MSVDSKQITKEKSRIFHIGLERREIMVIKSLFRLAPEMNDKFVFGEPTEDDDVDVVFVNGDDGNSIKQWEALSKRRPEVVAILICSNDRKLEHVKTIKKPLVFKKFVEILDAITGTESAVSTSSGSRKLSVLVVDDSFPARQYMKFKLLELTEGKLNLAVDFAEDGEKALQAVEKKTYDLVFLDVVMPGMDGYEICKGIKGSSEAYVAMLTGKDATMDKVKGSMAGCDSFLTKPPADDVIAKVLETVVQASAAA